VTSADIFKLAGAIIASVGGSAALILALSSWLGKVWANRILESDKAKYAAELESVKARFVADTERYKTSLKKSEFLFEKEYEAASEFVNIARAMRPTYAHPDMDWYEACDEIARSFGEHGRILEQFIAKHGAVLGKDVRGRLGSCIATAAEGKFRVGSDGEVDRELNSKASEFYADVEAVEESLLEIVRGQARV
jgi:hypothetical protein